jgi:UTP--glucose-1-phosphate uridylyltransferase
MARVRKAVLPVAGLGTRVLPATKTIPKELLTVVDRPILSYVVEEARAAGIEHLVFVTGRGKAAIEDYFDHQVELEDQLRAKGKTAMLDELLAELPRPGEMSFVRQMAPLGLGHAVWCARDLIGDEPFAVLLPDELLWNPGEPCLKQMVGTYEARGGNVISVLKVPAEHVNRYGIVDPGTVDGAVTEVRGLVEKPALDKAPSRLAVIGRYILQPEVMAILDAKETGAGGEIQLTDAMARLIGKQAFHAQTFDGARHDCGDKAGFIQANIALALERPDLAGPVRDFIRTL